MDSSLFSGASVHGWCIEATKHSTPALLCPSAALFPSILTSVADRSISWFPFSSLLFPSLLYCSCLPASAPPHSAGPGTKLPVGRTFHSFISDRDVWSSSPIHFNLTGGKVPMGQDGTRWDGNPKTAMSASSTALSSSSLDQPFPPSLPPSLPLPPFSFSLPSNLISAIQIARFHSPPPPPCFSQGCRNCLAGSLPALCNLVSLVAWRRLLQSIPGLVALTTAAPFRVGRQALPHRRVHYSQGQP